MVYIFDENMQNSMAFHIFQKKSILKNGAYDYVALTRQIEKFEHTHQLRLVCTNTTANLKPYRV